MPVLAVQDDPLSQRAAAGEEDGGENQQSDEAGHNGHSRFAIDFGDNPDCAVERSIVTSKRPLVHMLRVPNGRGPPEIRATRLHLCKAQAERLKKMAPLTIGN